MCEEAEAPSFLQLSQRSEGRQDLDLRRNDENDNTETKRAALDAGKLWQQQHGWDLATFMPFACESSDGEMFESAHLSYCTCTLEEVLEIRLAGGI